MGSRDRSDGRPSAGRPALAALYAGFLFTGALTVLPGTLLPRVAALHHLSDGQSGALLTIQFAASACGALLVRRHFAATLMRGYLLLCAGACLLMAPQARVSLPAMGLYGVGLGMAMTSTSMLVGRLYPASRGAALSTLNSCWSVGALVCPLAVAGGMGRWPLTGICLFIALPSAALASIPLLAGFPGSATDVPAGRHRRPAGAATLLGLALMGFLYVGIESGAGGWMSTYASRVVAWDLARSSLATAVFWGALLASRVLAPLVLRRVSEAKCLLIAIAGVGAGLLVLIAAHSVWELLLGAGCTGFALGPIFPLVIALTIERIGESGYAGWVFALAGFGGAVLPWVTGVLSSGTHSLRVGLVVLLAAAALLMVAGLRLLARRHRPVPEAATADA